MAEPAEHARALHGLIEPIHATLYLTEQPRAVWERLGLEPFAQGYVAGRSAPLGAVGAEAVTAIFYNFNPAVIALGLPAAWDIATPAQVLDARAEAIEAIFTEADVPVDGVAEATDLVLRASEGLSFHGRPLAAANAAVALPGTPFADLWQALAVVREHRGDGHVALLTVSDLSPVEALVLYASWQDTVSRRFLQRTRLWDDEAWAAAEDSLRRNGWLDDDGAPTMTGRAWRDDLEARTDELAASPWANLGEAGCRRLFTLLHDVADAIDVAGVFPRPLDLPDPVPA